MIAFENFWRSPHRRLNPLTGEWVLISPHRLERPWQGKVESAARVDAVAYDPNCYLCPGNARAGGRKNQIHIHTRLHE
jgi:UDPglucose--hexose-1-phosphate uridylyltransferase